MMQLRVLEQNIVDEKQALLQMSHAPVFFLPNHLVATGMAAHYLQIMMK
jgi:hypothetical protein